MNSGPADAGSDGWDAEPGSDAPTGTRWEAVPTEGQCGRGRIAWVLGDEVCSGHEDENWIDSFRGPMFRDGARVGATVFTVDGSHLWSLAKEEAGLVRETMRSGYGHPVAVEAFGDRLIVVSPDMGLHLVEAGDPALPKLSQLLLPGRPLQAAVVDETTIWVAAGEAGVHVVHVEPGTGELSLVETHAMPGFAAALAIDAARDLAVVAACDLVATVSLTTGEVLGEGWVDGAATEGVLVAPAKSVSLEGDLAFVAAGRFGAVRMNLTDVSVPTVEGNCTLTNDPAFYASGVDTHEGQVAVAAGEWGVDVQPIEIEGVGACTSTQAPNLDGVYVGPGENDETDDDEECSIDPPWDVLSFTEIWDAPSPRRDPIQVIFDEEGILAFGDARRLGMRAVDVRVVGEEPETNPETGGLAHELIDRYDEPRKVAGVSVHNGRLAVWGETTAVVSIVDLEAEPEVGLVAEAVEIPEETARLGFLADGQLAAVTDEAIYIDGEEMTTFPVLENFAPKRAVIEGGHIVVPGGSSIVSFRAQTSTLEWSYTGKDAALPPAVSFREPDEENPDAPDELEITIAAPEWTSAVTVGDELQEMTPHGVFDEQQVLDLDQWLAGPATRQLFRRPSGRLLELATLARRAALVEHTPEGSVATALPAGIYMGAKATEDAVYLLSADRRTYWSTLTTVTYDEEGKVHRDTHAFLGVGMDLDVDDGRLYVADADVGVRVFDLSGELPVETRVITAETLATLASTVAEVTP